MSGRDPRERGRASTPLELLYDLTYVIAFAAAAEQVAHHVADGHIGPSIGAYLFAIFSVSWAWMNFTWFASAYGNDDALFRVATIVQMVGVVILIFGLPPSFSAAVEGHSPNNALMVIGYIVMRVPLIAMWLRAARQDPDHRRVAIGYAVMIVIAQTGWVLTAVVALPLSVTIAALIVLAIAEMAAPVVVEGKLGRAPWNAGHIAERFSLLTIITVGEVVAATTAAVEALVDERGWSLAAVVIASSGLVMAATLWWAYFLIPSRTILEKWPERTFAWRYAHLPIFGGIAAIGAGLRVAAGAVREENLSVSQIALALAVPVGAVILMVFVMWSVLMRSLDLSHVPLLLTALAPVVAAVAVGLRAGSGGTIDVTRAPDLTALVSVVALVALGLVVEVVGHEMVGYRHTVRVVEQASATGDAQRVG
ncbi:low temperature requirement protein A [Sphaerisporangium sp. NPDC005288]|uniref:low temperature requirement protein A n=1 Tax=Sphaerisporangium sp. NPDC005288 TaxID=3155114 RepID=UPI0033B7454B